MALRLYQKLFIIGNWKRKWKFFLQKPNIEGLANKTEISPWKRAFKVKKNSLTVYYTHYYTMRVVFITHPFFQLKLWIEDMIMHTFHELLRLKISFINSNCSEVGIIHNRLANNWNLHIIPDFFTIFWNLRLAIPMLSATN